MSEEPHYDIICLEVRPGTKVRFIAKPEGGLVGIRTINAVPDSFLRKRFWTTWDALIEEIMKEGTQGKVAS